MASRFVILMGVLACAAAEAKPPAHHARRFALRDVRVEGNATPEETKLLEDRISAAIDLIVSENGDESVHPEEMGAALAQHPELKTCMDVRCGATLGDAVKADKVLSIGIERQGAAGKGDWMVRVWHFDVRALRVGASVDLPCNACTVDELLGDLSHSLGPALQAETGAMCTVKVSSRPEGATVVLDGNLVGATPFQHTLMPGKHAVIVEQKGFSRGEDELDCPSGSMQNMAFALTAGGTAVVHREAASPSRSPALKIVGAALIVLGAAGVAAGAGELYLDGRGACNLGSGQTQCKEVYDTKTTGYALVGVGAAALVGGVAVLVVDAVRGKPSRVNASIDLGPQGASLVARGSF